MLRWFQNLPITVKAFSAPLLLLFCLIGVSAKSYFFIANTAAGLESLSGAKLPTWNAVEWLSGAVTDTQILLFRYVSWLNSGVDAQTLRKAENEIETRDGVIISKIDELLTQGNLTRDERDKLKNVKQGWSKFKKLAKDAIEMGAVQPSMAVMTLGTVDDLLKSLRKDTDDISQSIKLATEDFATSMDQSAGQSRALLLGAIGIVIPLSIFVCLLVALSIVTPIRDVTRNMQAVSIGKLDASIGYADRSDEIGRMVKAIAVFRHNVAHIRALEERQHEEQRSNAEMRKAEMGALASDFETSVKLIASRLSEAARTINASSVSLARSAGETRGQSASMRQFAETASASVQTVASAAQQMSGTIQEIAAQVTKANDLVKFTAAETQRADDKIGQLVQATDHITSVVELIQEVAAGTNLLALNAAIEAARAGDAGRGFGVVAAEVKALANQTERATHDISARITAIRESCSTVAASIRSISEAMQDVESVSQTMAASVNEQAVATTEIASGAGSASNSVDKVAEMMLRLADAANRTDEASKTVEIETQGLLRDADTVNEKVDQFLAQVRIA